MRLTTDAACMLINMCHGFQVLARVLARVQDIRMSRSVLSPRIRRNSAPQEEPNKIKIRPTNISLHRFMLEQ